MNTVNKKSTITIIVSLGVLVSICTIGCLGRVDLEQSGKFQQAQKAFDTAMLKKDATAADFMPSVRLYREMLDSGVKSGAVYYNLGNALVKAGRPGEAVAMYRQSQQFLPRDPHVEANLRYALGPDAPVEQRSFLGSLLFWRDWLSYSEKFSLAGLCALVTFALAALALYIEPRRLLQRLAIGGVMVTTFAISTAAYDWYRFDYVQNGVIVAAETTAQTGPATSYPEAFTTPIHEGTEFLVIGQYGDWLNIRLPAGQEGWVRNNVVVKY